MLILKVGASQSAMTTINTIEDLFRLLDENPQWVNALRARLLTRALIELPEKFADFVTETTQRSDGLNDSCPCTIRN